MWTFAFAALSLSLSALPGPLVDCLKAGRAHNRTLQISRAQLAEQEAQVSVALASLTPTLQVQGAYARNQYASVVSFPSALLNGGTGTGIEKITIQPFNQVNATVAVNVPLLNADGITRLAQARRGRFAAEDAENATTAEVDLSISRAYYQTVAAQGVLSAAQRALGVSQDALAISRSRFDAGTANKLAVDRALVEVARAKQTVAEAERTLGLARRNLETLSGVSVQADLPGSEAPDLPDRAEQLYVEDAQRLRPEVLQAREVVAQASASSNEAWVQLVPSLTGNFTETLTNAPGFVAHDGYWSLGVRLAWLLDPVGTPASIRKADAALVEQEARLKQELETVRDDVHTSFLDIALEKARVEETSAEVKSAQEALKLTREQFAAGTATSLDLSQAQRDAFQAEANSAQSTANLAAALLGLKKAAGESLLQASE